MFLAVRHVRPVASLKTDDIEMSAEITAFCRPYLASNRNGLVFIL
jgi:hypothetical protein